MDAVLLDLVIFLARHTKDPLDLEARRALYRAVERYPGLHLSSIARKLNMETNHAKYHLRVLERHQIVSSRKEGGYWRFYPKTESDVGPRDVLDRSDKRALSMLRRKVPLHATLVLLDRDEATLGELADAVDVAASTMHYHAGKMEEAGLVESQREGRERVLRIVDPNHVSELLVRYQPPDEIVEGFLEAWEELEFP